MENREYTKVIEFVKTMILEDKLHLGEKLPTERDLADTLQLGRYSVREALRIMENMGLIGSRQGSGNYLVSNICKNITESMEMMLLVKQVNYREISQVRRAIELQAFQLAVRNVTKETLFELKQILYKMVSTSDKDNADLDKRYHYEIIRLSGNKLMISLMEALAETCENFIEHVLSNGSIEIKEKLMKTHMDIVASLEQKDIIKGIQSINLHYDLIDQSITEV